MKYISIYGMFVLSLLQPIVYGQTLDTQIESLIATKLPHATIGVLIKNAHNGQIVYSKNEDKLLIPASSIKLFTAAAALYQLPKNYRFTTQLSQNNHNFYFTFSGAPDFTTENLLQLLAALKETGTKMIAGDIVLDMSRFKEPYYTAGSSYDDLGWYYSAPETALILNENAVAFDFKTGKNLGSPVQINPKIPHNGVTIINELFSTDAETEQNHCSLHVESMPNNTLRLFGCLAMSQQPVTLRLAIPDPLLLAKEVIRAYLKSNHIDLHGQIVSGKTPPHAKIVAQIESADLEHLLNQLLKESDNLYASSITRVLGDNVTGEGSTQQGAFAIKQILAKHTHVNFNQLNIADGIGTRYNFATPGQIVCLLSDLYADKELYSLIVHLLPQTGVSGNLLNRMQKTSLKKIVFAKTGTMHDVSSLSGYILRPNKDPLIFSIIINGINQPVGVAKELEEEILERAVSSCS